MKRDSMGTIDKWVNFIRNNIALFLIVTGIIGTIAIKQFDIISRMGRVEAAQENNPNTEVLEYRLKTIESKVDTKADQAQLDDMNAAMDRIDANITKALDLLIAHMTEENN